MSDARNYGTKHATGDLIIYVDSDDFVEPDLIETLYYLMQEYNLR